MRTVLERAGKDEPPAVCVSQRVCAFLDVISHVGSRPHMRSLGPLARQISSLLSASVNKDACMLWSVVSVSMRLCVCALFMR